MRFARATLCFALLATTATSACSLHLEQRDAVASRRRSYNNAFFWRHNTQFRTSGAIHFAHGKQHDVLQLGTLAHAAEIDRDFEAECLAWFRDPPRMEPTMMTYGPHVGQAAWRLYQAIDWTHIHHEQTYDILSDRDIPWSKKAEVTRDAVDYYLENLPRAARSPAPLELTMRRAMVMMKPYFGVYRNNHPRSATFFYYAHWWHPAIYEAQMLGGNGSEQDAIVDATHATSTEVLANRPQRMLLSREIMPRYSRMSPESANIFDNLHMLHGIAYAILAYDGWTIDEKRAELYRVVEAMSAQPGDRELARKFAIEHPDVDPRRYEPWMRGYEGPMNKMMEEMFEGMWPMMSPDGSKEVPPEVREQLKMKLSPATQPGELPGSLHDAVMKLVPNMKMDKEGMKPGATPKHAAMATKEWLDKAQGMPNVEPFPMTDGAAK